MDTKKLKHVHLRVCVAVVFVICKVQANSTIEFFTQPINYRYLSSQCSLEGGVPLMKEESDFDQLIASQTIPFGQEFWVADHLYTGWVLPNDCARKSGISSSTQNVKVTSELAECVLHCHYYPFFAIKTDYCVCLDSSYNLATNINACSVECIDVGFCGGQDSQGRDYVNIYAIEPVLDPQIYVKTPSSMGSAYIECLTARCQQNDFRGMHCSSQIFYGLCGDDSVTSTQTSYTKALASCYSSSGTFFKDSCANVTNSVLWIGPMRFITQSPGGALPGLIVAKGAKCKKYTSGSVNCIPTHEETELPFVCKKQTGPGSPPTSTTSIQPDRNDDSDETAGIIIGCAFGGLCVSLAIVAFVYFCRKKNNKFKAEEQQVQQKQVKTIPKSVYETPKPREQRSEHEYADTNDVYHSYVELKDDGSTSYGQQNDAQSTGFNNDSYLKVPSNIPLNANDVNISMLGVDNEGYLDPKKSPNFGRKLPEIPHERL